MGSAVYKRGWIGLFIQNRDAGNTLGVESPKICQKGGGDQKPMPGIVGLTKIASGTLKYPRAKSLRTDPTP